MELLMEYRMIFTKFMKLFDVSRSGKLHSKVHWSVLCTNIIFI